MEDIIIAGQHADNLFWRLEGNTLFIEGQGDMPAAPNNSWDPFRDRIQTIIILDGVTSIAAGAFYNCKSLTQISIPASVTHICEDAFRNCENLTQITIPSSACIEYCAIPYPIKINYQKNLKMSLDS